MFKLSFIFILLKYSSIYNVVLASGFSYIYSVIHLFFFRFFPLIGYYKILSTVSSLCYTVGPCSQMGSETPLLRSPSSPWTFSGFVLALNIYYCHGTTLGAGGQRQGVHRDEECVGSAIAEITVWWLIETNQFTWLPGCPNWTTEQHSLKVRGWEYSFKGALVRAE